jgi:hypothetical protein
MSTAQERLSGNHKSKRTSAEKPTAANPKRRETSPLPVQLSLGDNMRWGIKRILHGGNENGLEESVFEL